MSDSWPYYSTAVGCRTTVSRKFLNTVAAARTIVSRVCERIVFFFSIIIYLLAPFPWVTDSSRIQYYSDGNER